MNSSARPAFAAWGGRADVDTFILEDLNHFQICPGNVQSQVAVFRNILKNIGV